MLRILNATAAVLITAALSLGTCRPVWGQGAPYIKEHYDKAEHLVPMRDGTQLFTIVYSPKDNSRTYPIMLFRTPYSIGPYGADSYRAALGPSADFARNGYIFAYQDVRGQFKSEGAFTVMRPIVPEKRGPNDTDESSDTYDTIQWLLDHVPNHNGRVGQWGISYPGSQTIWGLIDAHPALVASSPQAPAIDMWIGDDFHHNGAFRLMYTFGWLSGNASARSGPTELRERPFDYGTPDGYQFFLRAGSVGSINDRYFQNRVPTWNEYMSHPDYDEYWERQNPLKHLKNIKHAVLNVAGWFDAEDFYGPMETYRAIERQNGPNRNSLVVGPWLHGGWASMPGNSLGDIQFGSNTAEYYRQQVELPFFEHHLKDAPEPNLPEALVFKTGANEWQRLDAWPPAGTVRQLYFQPGGRLSFDPPTATDRNDAGYDEYISDPRKPVPFSAETRTSQGHLWMVEDQRFAATRPDVLVYESEVLDRDITVAGPVIASIWFSSTGTDADVVVKLIDVFPGTEPDNVPNPRGVRMGDFQMLLAGEVFRAKYRQSYSRPEPLEPGRPAKIEFDLRDRFHTFRKGHRIMVHVQSSWFPVIDRNPQQFMDIYRARDEDFQKATQRVYRAGEQLSGIRLNVLSDERDPCTAEFETRNAADSSTPPVASVDRSLPIRVNNPLRLPWQIPAERIAIGPGYKPSMALLPNGELVMVALFQEQHEGKLREWTGIWRSTDGGRTWSDRERVQDMIGREQWLTATSRGSLFATCHLLQQDFNNSDQVTHSYIHRSTDGGRSWKRTRIAGPELGEKSYTMCSRNVVELPDGTLVLGVGLTGRPGRVAYVWRSSDGGESWQTSSPVQLGQYRGEPYDNFDCFFTEDFTYRTQSGKWLHWIRCGPPSPMHPMDDGRPVPTGDDSIDRTMWCESDDGGQSWSDVRDFGEYGRMYPRVLRLQDGRLLMTYTQRSLVYPIGLRAQISDDDGSTWDFHDDQIILEGRTPWGAAQGGGFGNTLQTADDKLISCYSYRAADGQTYIEVMHWQLPPSDRAAKSTTDNRKLKTEN